MVLTKRTKISRDGCVSVSPWSDTVFAFDVYLVTTKTCLPLLECFIETQVEQRLGAQDDDDASSVRMAKNEVFLPRVVN